MATVGDRGAIGGFCTHRRPTKTTPSLREALQPALGPNLSIATAGLGFQGKRTIDHIALSGDQAAASLGIVSNVHQDGNLSDHFGVIADLSVSELGWSGDRCAGSGQVSIFTDFDHLNRVMVMDQPRSVSGTSTRQWSLAHRSFTPPRASVSTNAVELTGGENAAQPGLDHARRSTFRCDRSKRSWCPTALPAKAAHQDDHR